jgi:hypothetical protein
LTFTAAVGSAVVFGTAQPASAAGCDAQVDLLTATQSAIAECRKGTGQSWLKVRITCMRQDNFKEYKKDGLRVWSPDGTGAAGLAGLGWSFAQCNGSDARVNATALIG